MASMSMKASPTARMLPAMALSLIVSALMFWVMYLLIQGHRATMEKADTLPTIDFVRLKRETELQTLERRKPPPPPPPPKTPPPPKLKVAATDTPQESPLPFNMPNLGLSANVGGGPFLGQLGSGGGAPAAGLFDGDIIPLQRIAPQCPRKAALDGLDGIVTVQLLVNADGTVRSAEVQSAKPRGVFESAAVSAVLKWKFKPRVVDGKPVEQRGKVDIKFNCSGE